MAIQFDPEKQEESETAQNVSSFLVDIKKKLGFST